MAKAKGIVFSDIDGTFVRWSLFLYMCDKLVELGVFPKVFNVRYHKLKKDWQHRNGHYNDYMMEIVHLYEEYLDGVNQAEYETVMREVVQEHGKKVYRFTREIIINKLAQGWRVIFLSTSQHDVVGEFAELWKVDEYYGTKALVNEDKYHNNRRCFTGVREMFHGESKADKVREILDSEEARDVPMENVWGIGDTYSDSYFLEQVSLPICFQPEMELWKVAHQRGWPIVTERKDVIAFGGYQYMNPPEVLKPFLSSLED